MVSRKGQQRHEDRRTLGTETDLEAEPMFWMCKYTLGTRSCSPGSSSGSCTQITSLPVLTTTGSQSRSSHSHTSTPALVCSFAQRHSYPHIGACSGMNTHVLFSHTCLIKSIYGDMCAHKHTYLLLNVHTGLFACTVEWFKSMEEPAPVTYI